MAGGYLCVPSAARAAICRFEIYSSTPLAIEKRRKKKKKLGSTVVIDFCRRKRITSLTREVIKQG